MKKNGKIEIERICNCWSGGSELLLARGEDDGNGSSDEGGDGSM